jgi:lactate dehydrogenase-like 2-hydroxyacid dehydrogenase
MQASSVLILGPLAPTAQAVLEAERDCIPGSTPDTLRAALADRAQDIGFLLAHGGSAVGADLLDALPVLRVVVVCGVGYDGIDISACRQRGIEVTHTPDVLTDEVADLALALVLMSFRRLVAANRFLHEGSWHSAPFPLSHSVTGKSAGILGLGRIGKAISTRLQACGMSWCYHGRQRQADVTAPYFADLQEMAATVDALIIICPGGEKTRHLVNDRILSAMRPGSIVINVARGSVVDETALIRHLESGHLGAVGLDVFELEPQVPEALLRHPHAVLLPHVGSATLETRHRMGMLCIENIRAHLDARPLPTLIPEMRR